MKNPVFSVLDRIQRDRERTDHSLDVVQEGFERGLKMLGALTGIRRLDHRPDGTPRVLENGGRLFYTPKSHGKES